MRRGRDLRVPRPQRRGQDHDDPHDARAREADRRLRRDPRAPHGAERGPRVRAHRVDGRERRGVRQPHRAREPRDAARPARPAAHALGRRGRRDVRPRRVPRPAGRHAVARQQAAARARRARCCTSRRSSSSTSPPTGSTPSASPTCARCSSSSRPSAASRCSSRATSSPRSSSSPTRIGIIHQGRLLEEIGYDELRQRNREYLELAVSDTEARGVGARGEVRRARLRGARRGRRARLHGTSSALRSSTGRSWRPASASRSAQMSEENLEDHFVKLTGHGRRRAPLPSRARDRRGWRR